MEFLELFVLNCLNEGNPRPEILKWILAQKGWLLVDTTEPNQEYHFEKESYELLIQIFQGFGTEWQYAFRLNRRKASETDYLCNTNLKAFIPFLSELLIHI